MTKIERFPGKHPLCICPEFTFPTTINQPAPDLDACRKQSGGITHPMLTYNDVVAFIAQLTKPPGQEKTPDG